MAGFVVYQNFSALLTTTCFFAKLFLVYNKIKLEMLAKHVKQEIKSPQP